MKLKFKEILAFIIGAIAAAVLTYKLKPKTIVLPDIPKPVIRREVCFAELANHLRELFPFAYIQLSDSVKYLCDIDDINTFLKQDATDRIKYIKERYDCDDFAYRLKGQFSIPGWAELAIGIIWTKTHAQNCVVDANLDFWVIEPQNDNLMGVDYLEDKNVRFIII